MDPKFRAFLHANEGAVFHTVTGLPFTYELRKHGIYISRVRDDGEHTFTYENISKALAQMPFHSVAALSAKEIRGPSYCYAIIKKYVETK